MHYDGLHIGEIRRDPLCFRQRIFPVRIDIANKHESRRGDTVDPRRDDAVISRRGRLEGRPVSGPCRQRRRSGRSLLRAIAQTGPQLGSLGAPYGRPPRPRQRQLQDLLHRGSHPVTQEGAYYDQTGNLVRTTSRCDDRGGRRHGRTYEYGRSPTELFDYRQKVICGCLIAVSRKTGCTISVAAKVNAHYAVTAVDKMGGQRCVGIASVAKSGRTHHERTFARHFCSEPAAVDIQEGCSHSH